MPVVIQGFTLLQKLSQRTFNNRTNVFKTTSFIQWDSACKSFTVDKNSSFAFSTMPVITAVAVAAHRTTVHSHEQRLAALGKERRLSTSQCRSSAAYHFDDISRSFKRSVSMNSPMDFSSCIAASLLESNAALRTQDFRRYYAKGRDKPSTKKSVVNINEAEMSEIISVDSLKNQLAKTLDQMKEDFSQQLSVRGAAGALESLMVEFEGESYPLQELAQVGRKNPQLAVLNLSSLPDACQFVMKAIQASGMNLSPQQEGTTIYVPLPKVTREHRENLAKNAKLLFNKTKVALQAVQNKFVKQCKSQKDGVSEDLAFNVQSQIMKLTESYIEEAEKLLHSKQKELLEIK